MTAIIVFWLVSVALSCLIGWMQGHSAGVIEGRATEMLKRAGFERPMRRRG